jgi:hypothetical protein
LLRHRPPARGSYLQDPTSGRVTPAMSGDGSKAVPAISQPSGRSRQLREPAPEKPVKVETPRSSPRRACSRCAGSLPLTADGVRILFALCKSAAGEYGGQRQHATQAKDRNWPGPHP